MCSIPGDILISFALQDQKSIELMPSLGVCCRLLTVKKNLFETTKPLEID